MSAPIVYKSTDTSAPVLDGTAGSLITVLDAVLVNGYGSKAAAGWTKSFTGTNAASYRQGGGNLFYLDINDNGASTGLTGASGQEAAVRGYEAMTALATGTNPFPTTTQIAAATCNWRKSAAASATTRAWIIVADDRSFYLCILTGDLASTYAVWFFGDVYSLKSGDSYRTAILVHTSVNSASLAGSMGWAFATIGGQSTGYYIARTNAGTGTSLNGGYQGVGSGWGNLIPATLDGNVYLSRLPLMDTSSPYYRGWFRGVYEIIGEGGVADGDTFTGTGDFAGKSFLVVKGVSAGSGYAMAIETSNTWDTSS